MRGTMGEFSDDSGRYCLRLLPPGIYEVTVFYSDLIIKEGHMPVRANDIVFVGKKFDPHLAEAPSCSGSSTRPLSEHVPLPGQVFGHIMPVRRENVLGAPNLPRPSETDD